MFIFFTLTVRCDQNRQGPVFIYEPPHHVDFLNFTGAVVDCSAHSNPDPQITWILADGLPVKAVPRLRYVPKNGSLVFPSFSSDIYRQDVHTAVYRCKASNSFGTIVSPPVRVRAGMLLSKAFFRWHSNLTLCIFYENMYYYLFYYYSFLVIVFLIFYYYSYFFNII